MKLKFAEVGPVSSRFPMVPRMNSNKVEIRRGRRPGAFRSRAPQLQSSRRKSFFLEGGGGRVDGGESRVLSPLDSLRSRVSGLNFDSESVEAGLGLGVHPWPWLSPVLPSPCSRASCQKRLAPGI